MVVVRPDVDDLAGDTAMGWLRETQRIANAVAGSSSVVGYHDGVSLMAVIEGDGEIAESLFEALVFGRVEGCARLALWHRRHVRGAPSDAARAAPRRRRGHRDRASGPRGVR